MAEYGYAWFLDKLNWDTMTFRQPSAQYMMFNSPSMQAAFHARYAQIRDVRLDFLRVHQAHRWMEEFSSIPCLDLLEDFLRQLSLCVFRKDVFLQLKRLLHPDHASRALAGEAPLSHDSISGLFIKGAQPLQLLDQRRIAVKSMDTIFAWLWEWKDSHIKRNKLTHLVHALRGVSDEEIRKVLIQSGRRHLLAIPDSDLPSESEKVRFANVEIERRLEQYVNDEIVDRAVSECCDQMLDQYRTNAADVDEQVEDGKAELCNAANDYMKDMEEEMQKHKDKIEEQAQQCLNDIEDRAIEVEMSAQKEIAKLKRWYNASAQSLLDRKSGTSPELDTRRISI